MEGSNPQPGSAAVFSADIQLREPGRGGISLEELDAALDRIDAESLA